MIVGKGFWEIIIKYFMNELSISSKNFKLASVTGKVVMAMVVLPTKILNGDYYKRDQIRLII